MSAHCPKCGDYIEEDDSRPCAKCAAVESKERPVSDENVEREAFDADEMERHRAEAAYDRDQQRPFVNEWDAYAGGWLAHARASRPREAAGAPEACPVAPSLDDIERSATAFAYHKGTIPHDASDAWMDGWLTRDLAVKHDGIAHSTNAHPASAAGREGAREKFTKAALLWAEASKHDIACGAPFSSQERRDARMNTVARHMDALHAYDALLAAEAAERGEKEA